jgi:hypothetical protein
MSAPPKAMAYADHAFHADRREAERALDGGQGHVHDGRVQDDHELGGHHERRLLSALTPEQISELVTMLRQLLVAFEGSVSGDEFPRLGLALAPAHVTIETRRAVGLPEVAGLLVRGVEPGGRAERAGLRIGDVLVRAGDRELRSVSSLYAALNDAWRAGSLVVGAVRGPDARLDIEVSLAPDPSDHLFPLPVQPPGGEATHAV